MRPYRHPFFFVLALLLSAPAQLPAQAQLPALVAPDAALELLASGFGFTEGPAVAADGTLFFTDLGFGRIHQLAPGAQAATILRTSRADQANGLAFDAQGRLYACEGGSGRVSRTDADGTIVVLADQFDGKRFNAPNDLVIANDGAVYFTDPFFGTPSAQPQAVTGVYRIGTDGTVALVAADFDRPNGIALSPDGTTLYVTNDSPAGVGQIWAFDLQADGSTANGRPFAEAASIMDGMSVDANGNIYATSFPSGNGPQLRGVWVFDPAGAHLGTIPTPENPTNCTLAGQTLYITASTRVHSIELSVSALDRFQSAVETTTWGQLKILSR